MKKLATILALCIVTLAGPAWGATYYVPDNFGTIQAALDAAVDTDIIILRDGVYTGAGNKDLDFGGKAITLRSENGPDNCTIDCEYSGRGVYFHSGEGSDTVLEGITIMKGSVPGDGGGIHCRSSSSPTIVNCRIRENSANDRGGGLYSYDSRPTIVDCEIKGNRSTTFGGGLFLKYSPVILTNCLIKGNWTGGSGGGISLSYDAVYPWAPIISNCTISGNTATADGGGIYCFFSEPTVVDCILWANTAAAGPEISLKSTANPTSLTISHSDVAGGQAAVDIEAGCTLTWGAGNINSDPLFANGVRGRYYLSQLAAGQGSDSPCANVGSDTAANLGLTAYTTRTDEAGDAGTVDMGYHYRPLPELTRIHCGLPANESVLYSPPTFSWTANGGTNDVFAVDFSLSYPITSYWSTYDNMRLLITENSWTVSSALWARIPAGSYVYWRVRGADLDVSPLSIVTSDEVFWFYKP